MTEPETITLENVLHIPDLQKLTGGPETLIGYVDPEGYVAPDVSRVFPAAFQPPSSNDTPQDLFKNSFTGDPFAGPGRVFSPNLQVC
jgi:hypothetical protein